MKAERSGNKRGAARNSTRKHSTASGKKPPKLYRPPGSVAFPEARGKTVEQVYLTAEAECRQVIVAFSDNTELVVDIEPCLSFTAELSGWKTGEQRVIRRWPRTLSL